MLSSAVVASAGASQSRTATTNLACASQIVSTWTTTQLANETIAIPVEATNIGALAPAARPVTAEYFSSARRPRRRCPSPRHSASRTTRSVRLDGDDRRRGRRRRAAHEPGWFVPVGQTMGKNLNATQITAIARRVGTALSVAGVNTDLAPVLDVDGRAQFPGEANPDGYRSFGGVASIAAHDGTAFMKGLQEADVLSVVKHFPGLGYSTRNTDYGPAATLTWAQLQTTGLVPFRQAIANGATAVMMSNARIPGLSSLPAGLSPVVVQYLRTTLGFKGLIVTDSLSAAPSARCTWPNRRRR